MSDRIYELERQEIHAQYDAIKAKIRESRSLPCEHCAPPAVPCCCALGNSAPEYCNDHWKIMTDREILELAALAAGDWIEGWTTDADFVPIAILRSGPRWQPLLKNSITDCMGDAMRLAVRLNMDFTLSGKHAAVAQAGQHVAQEFCNADRYAATRRAILRVAAEIGKKLRDAPTIEEIEDDWT